MKKILLIILLLISHISRADYTIAQYQKNMVNPVSKSQMTFYLAGLGAGYGWANTGNKSFLKQNYLYCEPEKLGLNAYNYLNILDKRIEKIKVSGKPYLDNLIEIELLVALMDAFPCK
jgi:hypothetical protein